MLCEEPGLGGIGIDAVNKNVFQGDFLVLTLRPVAEGLEQVLDGPLAIDRHDPVAHVVAGPVKRDCQADLLGMIRQLADLGHESGGRNGEVAGADSKAPGRGNQFKGLEKLGQVGEGFSHSHEDDVVDLLSAEFLGEKNLPGDFVRGEIAGESIKPGSAELAAKGTTNLGRDTERTPIGTFAIESRGGGDKNTFNVAPIV